MKASGILFWLAAPFVLLLAIGACCSASPLWQTQADNAAAQRYKAAAEAARADAERIQAEAYAEAMDAYTGVAAEAITADRRAAHPLQYALETVRDVLLLLAGLALAVLVGFFVLSLRHPELVAAWAKRKPKPPQVDGDYRDAVARME